MTRPKAERRLKRELDDFVAAQQAEGIEQRPPRPQGVARCYERYDGQRCHLWDGHPTLNHVTRRVIWRVEDGVVTKVTQTKRR